MAGSSSSTGFLEQCSPLLGGSGTSFPSRRLSTSHSGTSPLISSSSLQDDHYPDECTRKSPGTALQLRGTRLGSSLPTVQIAACSTYPSPCDDSQLVSRSTQDGGSSAPDCNIGTCLTDRFQASMASLATQEGRSALATLQPIYPIRGDCPAILASLVLLDVPHCFVRHPPSSSLHSLLDHGLALGPPEPFILDRRSCVGH